jgi:TetR/AcrR family transcriptional repressor of mexJK operon
MGAPTLQTKRDERRDERRDAILDAARACFLLEGYGQASMSSIAAALGGSKGTLYNYFKSKEELFDAFVRRDCRRLAQDLLVFSEGAGDLTNRLTTLATAFLTLLLSPQAMAVYRLVVGEGDRFPELGRAFYAAGPQVIQARITQDFADLMASGQLRQADPALAAVQFKDLAVSGMHHLRLWGVIPDPTPAEIAAQAATAVATFLRAYAPD